MGAKERKEREKEIRVQQIMDAAKKIFSKKGFLGTTMEEIAQEAELTPGTLYYYFKNKGELYASLNLKILRYMHDRLEQIDNDKALTTEQKIHSFKDALYDVYKFDPLILMSLFNLQASKELWNLSDELFSRIKDLNTKSSRIITKIINDAISEGIIIDYHPVALSDIIYAIFSGLVLWEESKSMTDSRKNYLEKTMSIAFEIFIRGIKKKSQ